MKKIFKIFYTFKIDTSISVIDLLILLQYDPLVEYYGNYSNGVFFASKMIQEEINDCDYPFISNDPFYSYQWYLDIINAQCAWEIETGRNEIIVAIIDSGVDANHEDLGFGVDNYQNLIQGYNFVNDNSDITDIFGHGTSVAGIIGSKTNNNL